MRTILIAMLLGLGVGLIGTSSTFSAPIAAGASAVAASAGEISPVVDVYCRRHHRWSSRVVRRCWY